VGLRGFQLTRTELAFAREIAILPHGLLDHKTAIFRQINKHKPATHHDALEFPDGRTELLTLLCDGQMATVLQLPAQPISAAEAEVQTRVAYVGCLSEIRLVLWAAFEAAHFFRARESNGDCQES
jgi:hypothetical protein